MRRWQPRKVSRERYYISCVRACTCVRVCVVYAYVGVRVHLPVDRVLACKL